MNGKKMTVIMLSLLICLNLFLFVYYLYQKSVTEKVPAERLEQITKLYEENGIHLTAALKEEKLRGGYLKLGEADLDAMAQKVLEDGFDKSYIYGSKVQYTAGDVTIITDWQQHQVFYESEIQHSIEEMQQPQSMEMSEEEQRQMLFPFVRSFAQKWLGTDVYLVEEQKEEEGFRFVFCQVQEEVNLYFNRIEIHVMRGGIKSARLTYWETEGETEKSYNLLPVDEILYAQLGMIKKEMRNEGDEEVVQLLSGYQLTETEEGVLAAPALTIVLKSGKKYTMNRIE